MKRMKVRKSTADGTEFIHPTKGWVRRSVKSGRASAIVNMINAGQLSPLNLPRIQRYLKHG